MNKRYSVREEWQQQQQQQQHGIKFLVLSDNVY
jgi:hypothetical protein